MRRNDPPPGGRVIKAKSSYGNAEFFKFTEPGEALLGILLEPRMIKDEERFVLQDEHGHEYILPGHFKLRELLSQCTAGNRVWLRYDGDLEIEGGHRPMKTYSCVEYPAGTPISADEQDEPDEVDDDPGFDSPDDPR
jgi:hypothetical protein